MDVHCDTYRRLSGDNAGVLRDETGKTLQCNKLWKSRVNHPLGARWSSSPSSANLEASISESSFEVHLPLRDEDLKSLARAWHKLRALIFYQSDTALSDPDHVSGSVARLKLARLHILDLCARGRQRPAPSA